MINGTHNKSLKPTVTHVTLFAEEANPAPRYCGLVPPFHGKTMSIRMKKQLLILFAFAYSYSLLSQGVSYKDKAHEAFAMQDYPTAIYYLHQALEDTPKDKELYYYLGYYYHYNAYDSRPLAGYNAEYSDTVFHYLDKALELDPNYGDAKYFYTAECGAAVSTALRSKEYEKLKYYYQKAADIGGFPAWVEEYGRLVLSQVEQNGILITLGDFTLNVCRYLQVCKDFRNDITVLAWGHLNRPYYVLELKVGESRRNLQLDLSKDQIMDMHPYKWDTVSIDIKVPESICEIYGLKNDYKMIWVLAPNLFGSRSYLSCETAIMLSIIESNNWERPIFFQYGIAESTIPGIDKNLTNFGVVDKLVPFNTQNTKWEKDIESMESLLSEKGLKDYGTILETNQPRVSALVLYTYYSCLLDLAEHYKLTGQLSRIDDIIEFYRNRLVVGVHPEYEKRFLEELQNSMN
jgi:tetratricopeptide (TPR) repeat protein